LASEITPSPSPDATEQAAARHFARLAANLGLGGAGSRNAKIFLSYRRDDSRADARSIYQGLQRKFTKDRLFMDVDTIQLGRDFRHSLNENLKDCSVLIAVIGPNWLDARDKDGKRRLDDEEDYVRREIADALARKILVVPVLIDRTAMPTATALPNNLEGLAYCQAAYLRHESFSHDLDLLEQKIGEVAEPQRRTLWPYALAGVLAIVVLAAAPWWFPWAKSRLTAANQPANTIADNVEQFVSHYTLAEYVESLRVGLKTVDEELANEKDPVAREKLQQRRAALIEKISDPTSGYLAAARSAAQTMSVVGTLGSDKHQQDDLRERLAKNDTTGAEEILEKQLADAQNIVSTLAEQAFTLAHLKEFNDLDVVAAEPYYVAAAGYSPDNRKYLRAAADVKSALGKYLEAEHYLSHLVELASNLTGPERRDLATAERALARLFWDTGAFEKSAKEFDAALSVIAELKLDKTPLAAAILDERGVLLWKEGLYDEAEQDLRRAVDYASDPHDDDESLALASALNSLASLLVETGGYSEAQTLFAKALDIQKRIASGHTTSPHIAPVLNNIGLLRRKQGQLGLAFTLNRQALEMYVALYGPTSPDAATTTLNQAIVLCRMNKLAEAETMAGDSEKMREHYFGTDNRLVVESESVLAYILLQSGKFDAAAKLAAHVYDTRLRVMPYNKIYLAKALDLLGLIALKKNDIPTAKSYLERAYQTAKVVPEADKIVTPIILAHLSELLAQADDPTLANEISDQLARLAPLDIDCAR
jgi:tetratricopeptide (TPR) repeat protein